jgi:uncharacterized membrane protein YccC
MNEAEFKAAALAAKEENDALWARHQREEERNREAFAVLGAKLDTREAALRRAQAIATDAQCMVSSGSDIAGELREIVKTCDEALRVSPPRSADGEIFAQATEALRAEAADAKRGLASGLNPSRSLKTLLNWMDAIDARLVRLEQAEQERR